MQMIITPNDIILRCLWDKYKKYRLIGKTEEEIKKIVDENKPFQILEEEAYAIGLLKVIETDNLIHVFVGNIIEMLQIKSNVINDELYINKTTMLKELNKYMLKFPEYFNYPRNYEDAIVDLQKYLDNVIEKVTKMDTISVKNRDKVFTYYKSTNIKKLLKY